ncbi:hypothetical protein YC2023_060299 [Brassica napus]
MSLKPKPPTAFGCEILVHEIQHIFFFSSLPFHQKRVRADCIRLHKLTEI